MSYFSIAAMQLDLPEGNNLALITERIRQAKQRFPWLNMVVLSELCTTGPATKHAVPFPSEAEHTFAGLSEELDLWIVSGSQFEKDQDKIFNTSSVFNNHGERVTRYRKIFPFKPYEQDVSPGTEFTVFDTPQARIGLAICYDLWFPEVARTLVCMGAEVLLYPTMTGTIDRAVELDMAKATAAMFQCYVIAVNPCGNFGNGRSIIVGPDGRCIHQAGETEEIIPYELDLNLVRRSRENGLDKLGQPLKSFRDSTISYPQYGEGKADLPGLKQLGELKFPSE
ncbi:carbon-nitrogen hydrolase family protein [Aestuariibacter halophilus]|uniref:Carbon-nitrogen hydrolase family protein n=1 Tax=Fluctibacter halophilus TaxID=226011 RepID=A0ABS8G270_9ALTE|nr:carbon-nitrogen hydrolase family protein [Aestuariibacter halophilus]MCC2614672.1 carbon-nitrogen hydrolase family protein [Aestuariibacter halophilus]